MVCLRADREPYVPRLAIERFGEDCAQSKMGRDVSRCMLVEAKTCGAATLRFVENLKHHGDISVTKQFGTADEWRNSGRERGIQRCQAHAINHSH